MLGCVCCNGSLQEEQTKSATRRKLSMSFIISAINNVLSQPRLKLQKQSKSQYYLETGVFSKGKLYPDKTKQVSKKLSIVKVSLPIRIVDAILMTA